MARIAGVDLPRDKRIEIALTYIYGIGLTTSQRLLKETGINPDTRARDLTEDEVVKLRDIIDKQVIVEGDLRREQSLNISDSLRSAAIAVAVIVWVCQFVDRILRITLVLARVLKRLLLVRRNKGGLKSGS